MRVGVSLSTAIASLLIVSAVPLSAQPARGAGPRVSGFFSGSFGDGGPAPSFGGSVGYRFSPHFGFELDAGDTTSLELEQREIGPVPLPMDFGSVLSRFPGLATRLPGTISSIYPSPIFPPFVVNRRARVVHFLANFVGEFPTPARWLRPYVLGGGGVANIQERDTFSFGRRGTGMMDVMAPGFGRAGFVGFDGGEFGGSSRSQTALAMNAGGGVDFQLWRGLALGADVRYLHLFAQEGGFNFARVGARVSYRFGTRGREPREPREPRRPRRRRDEPE